MPQIDAEHGGNTFLQKASKFLEDYISRRLRVTTAVDSIDYKNLMLSNVHFEGAILYSERFECWFYYNFQVISYHYADTFVLIFISALVVLLDISR